MKPLNTKSLHKVNDDIQIFLGGSCNPTTWRQAIAIPHLEKEGISYYNPQVDDWNPDLVHLESMAKQRADILFFVIDHQTRSTVGLIESAYIAGQDKKLVLVMNPFDCFFDTLYTDKFQFNDKGVKASSTCMKSSSSIYQATKSSYSHVTTSNRISQHTAFSTRKSSEKSATTYSIVNEQAKSGSVPSIENSDAARMITKIDIVHGQKKESQQNDESSQKVDTKYLKYNKMKMVTINGEAITSREFKILKDARCLLKKLVSRNKIPIFFDIHEALKYTTVYLKNGSSFLSKQVDGSVRATFEDLDTSLDKDNDIKIIDSSTSLNIKSNLGSSDTFSSNMRALRDKTSFKDVYLSVDSEDFSFFESTLLPMLNQEGLSYNLVGDIYAGRFEKDLELALDEKSDNKLSCRQKSKSSFVYLDDDISTEDTRVNGHKALSDESSCLDSCLMNVDEHLSAINKSKILLFVITNKCRGLSVMVLAAYCMTLFRRNIVLFIQYLDEPCMISGEFLSKSAISDYNRGRLYLSDHAGKSDVPVFNSIRDAIECCGFKCRCLANKA